jgi:hypothetical protein
MSIVISEVYDAFISAGAPEDKARKAAKALTVRENRFAKIENDLVVIKRSTCKMDGRVRSRSARRDRPEAFSSLTASA